MAGGEADWRAVDDFIQDRLLPDDPVLTAVLAENDAAGLPPIDVSAAQGAFLGLVARMVGARAILEVGTLGGYSTILLARAVGEGGRVVTLEIDPHHAAIARSNVERAGLADRVDIRTGPALDSLAAMVAGGEGPFDMVFIDADKDNNPHYFRRAMELTRPGAVVIVDNVVREGRVLDADTTDGAILGTRALYEAVAAEPRFDATALQTVGAKGWDGFVIGIVGASA